MAQPELKTALIAVAIKNLEEFIAELRADIKTMLRGEGATDEGGFSGDQGDFSAMGTENSLRDQALLRRVEVEKRMQLIVKLKAVNTLEECESVCYGALVETNHGTFFFTHALRPVQFDGKPYQFLGTDSPIYQEMAGKKAGEIFTFREIAYEIKAIS